MIILRAPVIKALQMPAFSKPEATLKEQMESTHRLEVQFGMVKQRAEERRLRIQAVIRKN